LKSIRSANDPKATSQTIYLMQSKPLNGSTKKKQFPHIKKSKPRKRSAGKASTDETVSLLNQYKTMKYISAAIKDNKIERVYLCDDWDDAELKIERLVGRFFGRLLNEKEANSLKSGFEIDDFKFSIFETGY
jgi:hypothetical protein